MENQIDQDPEPVPESLEQHAPDKNGGPALVITIQSWATPLVGFIMLAIGLAGGYFGRTLLDSTAPPNPATIASSSSAVGADPVAGPSQPTPEDQDARRKAVMDAVISQTSHFKGDPDAPVTLIEFSDFQ